MNRNELIKNLKLSVQKLLKLESMVKTTDGKELSVSAVEVGGEVFIVDENGNNTPVENGDYILDSGETLVVVDGKISEIKPVEEVVEAEETPTVEPAEVDVQTGVEDNAGEVAEIIKDLVDVVTETKVELAKVKEELSKIQGKKPAVTPIVQKKIEFSSNTGFDKSSEMEKVKELKMKMISRNLKK